ncbi:hypothetical protein [Streptomyces sp. VNUA74]|uniref:hypothetical protein n=1 Tax=Streptomyces sp. VNUA74 TaxID=3062685 RepID=UPI00280AE185|nr:hypothetical protein [Streptomyces sp. VNUA74]WML79172.1 hypothetical protein Q3101_04665 [Streptomyces sp. VNUA74]
MKNLLQSLAVKTREQKVLLFKSALPVLLAVAGLSMVSVGIGMIFAPAGVITGGLSLLLLEQRTDKGEEGRS